jgi:Phage integrase, N-terminal SAM-like domain
MIPIESQGTHHPPLPLSHFCRRDMSRATSRVTSRLSTAAVSPPTGSSVIFWIDDALHEAWSFVLTIHHRGVPPSATCATPTSDGATRKLAGLDTCGVSCRPCFVPAETSLLKKTGQYLDEWLEGHVRLTTQATTCQTYRRDVERLRPYIGNIRLDLLRHEHIQHAYTELLRTLSPGFS